MKAPAVAYARARVPARWRAYAAQTLAVAPRPALAGVRGAACLARMAGRLAPRPAAAAALAAATALWWTQRPYGTAVPEHLAGYGCAMLTALGIAGAGGRLRRAATATVLALAGAALLLVPPAGTAQDRGVTAGHLRAFAVYAERLGLERSTVALDVRAGQTPRDGQRVLDLRGRTDPQVAAAWSADDMAALRRYVLDRARPEFVHVHGALLHRTGLTAERLVAHGYRPLLRTGDGGDFVHRSAVTAPDRLPELRRWAARTIPLTRTAHTG